MAVTISIDEARQAEHHRNEDPAPAARRRSLRSEGSVADPHLSSPAEVSAQSNVTSPSPVSKRDTAVHSLKVNSPVTGRNSTGRPGAVGGGAVRRRCRSWRRARAPSRPAGRPRPASRSTAKTASSCRSGAEAPGRARRRRPTRASTISPPPTTNHTARGRGFFGGAAYGGGPYGVTAVRRLLRRVRRLWLMRASVPVRARRGPSLADFGAWGGVWQNAALSPARPDPLIRTPQCPPR